MDRSVRPLVVADFESVMALEVKAHAYPWSDSIMRQSLERHRGWGVFEGEVLLGFAIFSSVLDESELLDCVVDPDRQGEGLGRYMLEMLLPEVESFSGRVYLEVRESNAAAIALYHSTGFVEVGCRKGYYPVAGGREDALLMALEFGGFSFSG